VLWVGTIPTFGRNILPPGRLRSGWRGNNLGLFGSEMEEATGGWIKLRSEEFYNLYLTNIIRTMK
jgi:hypothetical protein